MVGKRTPSHSKKSARRDDYAKTPMTDTSKKPRNLMYQNDVSGPEKKEITLETTGSTFAATAIFDTPVFIGGLTQGTGRSERIGRKVHFKSLLMRFNISTTATIGSYRLLVVYDKQANGAVPAITDILVSTAALAPMNLNNADRFVILFDCLINIQDINLQSVYRKINMERMHSGTTSAITDVTSGSFLYLKAPIKAADAATMDITFRFRYTDL